MRKYLLLLSLITLIACGDSSSTKYCADGSLAPCNDGSIASSPANNAIAPGYVPPVQNEQRSQQSSSSSSDSGGISWGSAILGYAVGSMLSGSSSRNETVRERIIERPTETRAAPVAPVTPNKSFNNQSSRNADVKPPAAKPSGSYSAPKSSSSSSFGGSSSRSSGGRR